jgi:hypothetical protein
MKEKENNDIFETRSWCYSVVKDPYQVMAEAFSLAGLPDIRFFIKKVIHYSGAKKIFPGEPPCDVLLYMRLVKSLIKAANILKEKKNGPIDVSEHDAFNKNYYCSHYQPSNGWEQFPRFISLKEFCNPYRVFKKFFKYENADEWLHDWEQMVDAGLSPCSGELNIEMIAVYTHLCKLTEAAHLINIREVNHIGGILKNRVIS